MPAYYTYRGAGRAMPSVVVVAAEDEDTARVMAWTWAEEHGIAAGSMRLDIVARIEAPVVVYAWDGDYE